MAKKWVKRLSLGQLDRISHVANDLERERREGHLTAARLVERIDSLHDPEILRVVSSSVAVCAITS